MTLLSNDTLSVTKSHVTIASHQKSDASALQKHDASALEQKSGDFLILGTIAKIASPPPIFCPSEKLYFPSDAIREKFELQSESARLLPDEKVCQCLRGIIPTRNTVEIHHDPQKHTAHYKNLITCGRLWQCPVCAARITEHRAADLLQAVTRWHEIGGFCALATFTLQHKVTDDLRLLTDAVTESYRKFTSGAPYQRFKECYGLEGSIKALEPTYGGSGWHPHLHVLMFLQPMGTKTFESFQRDTKTRWSSMVKSTGRYASFEHGADIRTAQADIYDYVAKFGRLPKESKWTIEREIAKAPTKKAHVDGKTPFQLLRDSISGNRRAGELFQEYSQVFKRRNQLVWSRGLRTALELPDEKCDEEIAAELPLELVLMLVLPKADWKAILGLSRDLRGELLAIAALGDKTRLLAFLTSCGVNIEGV